LRTDSDLIKILKNESQSKVEIADERNPPRYKYVRSFDKRALAVKHEKTTNVDESALTMILNLVKMLRMLKMKKLERKERKKIEKKSKKKEKRKKRKKKEKKKERKKRKRKGKEKKKIILWVIKEEEINERSN